MPYAKTPRSPMTEKENALDLPLCGDIFFLAAFYPAAADSLFMIIDALIAHDREQRFLPKVLQCKRLTRSFYNKEKRSNGKRAAFLSLT